MTSTIETFIGERHVGDVVVETRPGFQRASMAFTYRDDWIAFERSFDISPDLPLQRGPQAPAVHREMFVAFGDAAPDFWGRALLRAQARAEAQQRGERFVAPTEIDLLLRVPDRTRQGALRFRADGAFVGDETSTERARPKAWVHDDERGSLLAKLPAGGDIGAWEHATAMMMHDAGIRTSASSTMRLAESRSIFLTQRFDRAGASATRLPYMSVRSLMRLEDRERPDYATIAQAVARICADPRRARHELFDRAVFSALVRNHDDHMRNHGVLRSNDAWALSPAFDVNPGRFAGEGTPLVPGGDALDRDVRELVEHADAFSLTREAATRRVREIVTVTSRWRDYARRAGVLEDAIEPWSGAFEGPNLPRAQAL